MELAEICKKLKRSRLDKNISLQDASRQTKIPPNVLGKIEGAENLDSLGKFYLKGFLKIYSQFLEQDDLIKEIDALLPKDKEKRSIFKFPVEKKQPPSRDIRSAREAQKKQIKREEKEKEHTPPPAREKLKSENAVISLRNNFPVVKLGVKIFFVIILLIAVLLLLKLPPKKTIEKETAPPPIKKQIQTEKPAPAIPSKKEVIKPLVSILTKGNVFVEVKADGKLIFQNIIIEGIKESWVAKEILEIKLSNPSLVSLEIGTKSIPTSNTKRPVTYVITPEGFQVRK